MMELKELIHSIDIVDYVSQYIELEEKNGEYWGLSPFKPEKTPSFSVRRESGTFYDFSSGIGGNLYTFIRFYHKCSRREAIEKIKTMTGFDGKVMAPVEKLTATKACNKYSKRQEHIKESKVQILPDNYMERYEDRDDKLQVWRDEGISDASLQRFQVKFDSYANRLVYPIRNINGKIVNIGGRTLDPNWKELKIRKYGYYFPWGRMETIYGLAENMDSICDKHEVILFEGCKSVLIADSWGIKNTGAILTSHLNPAQMKILARLGCDVVFALDKDVNIRADHNIEKLRRYVNVSYIYDIKDLLDEKDSPVDKGEEVFRQLYNERFRYK